jgi:hypothetical protein
LIVRDVDLEFSEVKTKGIAVVRNVQVQSWGARAFRLNDPSGNEILGTGSIQKEVVESASAHGVGDVAACAPIAAASARPRALVVIGSP